MTFIVENVCIPSNNDPNVYRNPNRNPNPNPNHKKIIPKSLTLSLTLLPSGRKQESYRA